MNEKNQVVDLLDTAEATTTMHLEPIVQHNTPAVQGSREIVEPAGNSPMGNAMAWLKAGGTMDQLREMLDLQERFDAKQAEKSYNVAFAAFKAEAVHIFKNRTVTDGPLKGKSYAELHAVVDAVTPALSKHGLSASWKLTRDERDWLEVTCTLKHVDGHSESVSMGGEPDVGGAKNKLQARASAKSYLERYTLKAVCGVAEGGQDDDGRGDADPVDPYANIDPALLQRARDESLKGWKALAAFTKKITEAERNALLPASASLKDAALAADKEASNNGAAK